jgi:predicted nucleic acid-binding protein
MNTSSQKTLYLDVCTLCRPFDDQDAMRIRIETDGYFLLLQAIKDAKYQMVVSPVHLEEVRAISDLSEKFEILTVISKLGKKAQCDVAATKQRAEYLHSKNFGIADAAHVAFAEATSDVFITCDYKLIKKCKKERVRVAVMNPAEFCISENLT